MKVKEATVQIGNRTAQAYLDDCGNQYLSLRSLLQMLEIQNTAALRNFLKGKHPLAQKAAKLYADKKTILLSQNRLLSCLFCGNALKVILLL